MGVAPCRGVAPLAEDPAERRAGLCYLPARDRRLRHRAASRAAPRRPCRATPYLYSADEITSLLEATAELRPALRAATYYGLIGLLAVSGIRIGEAISLDDHDLDLECSMLVVRNSKFGKSRLVPLHSTATAALLRYRELRDELCAQRSSPALFVSSRGTRLLHSNIQLTFAGLTKRCGIARRSGSCRPRVHDLRH